MRLRGRILVVGALLTLCLASCGGGDADSGSAADCETFSSTYDLIQEAIFEKHGCTADICHGSARLGGLDLRAGASYEQLIDVPAQTVPGLKRVDPGLEENSLLWINLAAKTRPEQWTAPLRPMPLGLDGLSPDELEALRLWLFSGASRTGAVAGTAALLNACLPDPEPQEVIPLPPPAPDEGIQLHMPVWILPAGNERDVCFASYYDLTGQVPAYALSADGTRFRYNRFTVRSHAMTHHMGLDVYRGDAPPNDPAWGRYVCKGGERSGEPCDPLAVGSCGAGADCATEEHLTGLCIGFGPVGFTNLVGGGIVVTDGPIEEFRFPGGVYDEIPLKGLMLWDSHGFNLTERARTIDAWVNFYFPPPAEQQHEQTVYFNTEKIFWSVTAPLPPIPELPAFETLEVCHIHVFERPDDQPNPPVLYEVTPVMTADQTLHLFLLRGHMHAHGKRYHIFRGAFTCQGGSAAGEPCSPVNATTCPGGECIEATGRRAEESLLYENFSWNDPVLQRFDPPLVFYGSSPRADRSLTYCALYDNGASNALEVKRRSTSPPAGTLLGVPVGGPCAVDETRCIGGPQHNQLCHGEHAFCDAQPGAGDGDCDACPLKGGLWVQDEMLISGGNFWIE